MDVTWRIEPAAAGTRVTIEHAFAARLPLLAAIVQRLFVRPIAGRTLATFKAHRRGARPMADRSAAEVRG